MGLPMLARAVNMKTKAFTEDGSRSVMSELVLDVERLDIWPLPERGAETVDSVLDIVEKGEERGPAGAAPWAGKAGAAPCMCRIISPTCCWRTATSRQRVATVLGDDRVGWTGGTAMEGVAGGGRPLRRRGLCSVPRSVGEEGEEAG